MPDGLSIQEPLVKWIVAGSVGLIVLAIALRIWSGRRAAAADARRREEHRQHSDQARLQQEEVKKLADRIMTTSSTGRVTGFTIVRQVETIVTDGRASSVAALELCKALAAHKGGNAIINLQTQQIPGGKWVASGDAVIVKNLGRRAVDPDSSPQRHRGTESSEK